MNGPSLKGCRARIDRTIEHLRDLESRTNQFRRIHQDHFTPQYDHKTGKFTLIGSAIELPDVCLVLTGEIIYNLRAALDYLIFELAWLDSKRRRKNTQFLIEDCEKDFWGKRDWRLPGLCDRHVAAIALLQPYNGCEWTRLIRDLSDKDKHRELVEIAVGGDIISTIRSVGNPVAATDMSTSVPGMVPVNVDLYLAIRITFEDGSPVIETLEVLKTQVTQTINSFQPEF